MDAPDLTGPGRDQINRSLPTSSSPAQGPTPGSQNSSSVVATMNSGVSSGGLVPSSSSVVVGVSSGAGGTVGSSSVTMSNSGPGPGPGGGASGVGMLPGGMSTGFSNNTNGSLNLQPSSANPSKRLKVSDSTESHGDFWDLASELPDELTFGNLDGGLLGPSSSTINTVNTSINSSLSLPNTSVSGMVMGNNNNTMVTSNAGHLGMASNVQFTQQQQMQVPQQQQPQQAGHQQLSQILSNRTQGINIQMPQQSGQRLPQTQLQAQLQARPNVPGPGPQMRYTGPVNPQQPQQQRMQMIQQPPQNQPQYQVTQQQPQQQQQSNFVGQMNANTRTPQNQVRFPQGNQPMMQPPQAAPVNQSALLQSPMNGGQMMNQMASSLGCPVPGGSGNGSADPEKRKLIQQQLVLLLHAHKCQRREQQGGPGSCTLPHCRTMKQVLNHMTGCTAGKQCTVPHCASSRQIISHWKNCTRADCPVCLPLKQASDRRNQQNHQIGPGSFSANVNNAPSNNSNSFINSLMPPSSQGPAAPGTQSSQPPINIQTSTGPLPAANQPPSMQGAYQMLGLSYNSGSPSPRGSQSIAGGQIRPSLQGGASVPVQQVGPQGPNSVSTGPTPIVTNGQGPPAKDWHSSVTQDLRNHLIQKIVQAIFPASDPNAYRDNRMKNLFAYAEKVERDMYDTANSREEYYHLLAEKIYKIQKELEEKRQKRREQQQLQQQQGQIQNQQISSGGSQPQLQNQTPISAGQQGVGMRPTLQQNQMSSTAIGGRMNLNMAAPPNVTIQTNHMPPHSGQQPQYFVQPPTPGQQQGQVRPATSNSSPAFANVTLQGMLQGHPSQSPSTLFSGIQNQQQSGQTQQPNTPQAPSSVMSMASNSTPPPPRPSSVPGAANKLQAQLMNQSGQGTIPSGVQIKQENGPPTVSIPGLDSDMTLEKMLTKTEPKDPLDEFIMGTSSSVTTGTSLSAVVSEGKTSLEVGVKKDESEEPMEGIDDSSQGGKGKEEPPKSSTPGVTSTSAITSSSTPSASKPSPSSDNVSSSDSKSSVSSATPSSSSAFSSSSSSPAVRPKKVFKPNEIRQALMPTLEKLLRQDPESLPFRQPVDPVLLNIPDYFDIIKKPMDLSTIKKRLDHGEYQDPWQYIDDVYLMFDNARLYNRKTSKVYRYCTKLNEIFEQEIDPVMQNLGYCCGRRHVFQPQVLCCFGKQLCTIPRDAKYMSYENKITYCMKCFSEITTDYVSVDSFGLDPSLTGTTTVAKDQFKELKNDHLDYEPFVECKECGRSLHQVCVIHLDCIWSEGFTCEGCLRAKGKKRKENRYSAKRLPPSRLGTFIENRVNNFLRKKEAGAGEVTIRVVSSSEKTVEVKPGMKARYEGEWPDTFPYKAKALFAFEDFNGVDVCFFGMHVQEYGSDAPPPNSRRVYIAYLDSVHFFRPKQYRTAVYHEILLGYLEYAKKQGYTMAHIWACPPSEGDDYIFHCHPPEQKIPKPKRLQDWYKKMLDIGIQEKIVVSYQDILKQAQQDGVQSAKDLPYFEGDFWPNVIEDSIKEIEMEQQKQQQQQNESGNGNSNHATDDDSMDTTSESGETKANDAKTGDSSNGPNQKNQKKSGANKKSNKKQNQRKNNQTRNKSGGQVAGQPQLNQAQQWEQELTSRIYATMEKHKEVFFVIRLHSLQAAATLGEIHDPDQLINCDLMDGRDAFLTLAREKHYEFSSLRRAKFSSVALLWELHNSTNGGFVYTCNRCKRHVVETRWHCTECDDFDLCGPCYRVENHPHRMEKSGDFFGAGDADVGAGGAGGAGGEYGGAGSAVTSPGEARKESIKRCIQSLVHACQCKDANCRLPSCHKMKCVVRHAKQCKRKGTTQGSPGNNCPICKQLIALCCYHAKHCNEAKCTVPYCVNIKAKLKQQQLQQRFQQQAILRRRIANMNSMTAAINASSSNDNGGNTSNFPGHSGMKPMTVTPPPGALQAVQQVQAAVRQQQQQQGSHSIGKGGGGKGIPSGKGSGGKPMPSPGGPPTPSSVGGGKGNIYGKGNPVHGYSSPAPTPPNSMMAQMRPMTPQGQGGMDPMQIQQQNQQRLMLQQQQQAMPHPQQPQQPPQYMQQGQMQWQPQQQPQTSQPQMGGPGQRMRMASPGAGKPQQQMLQQQLMGNQGVGGPTMVSHNQSPQGQPSMMSQPLQQQMMPQQGQIPQSGLPPQSQGQGMPSATSVQNIVGGNVRATLGGSQLAMSSPVMQQLLATLRSPHSPQQQQEVLQILKSNPQVMAAFIKQRQQQQQQWQRTPQMQNAPQMPTGQQIQPGQQQQQWQRAPQMQTAPQMQPGQQLQPNQQLQPAQQQQQWQRPPQMQPGQQLQPVQQQQQWQRAPQMQSAPQMQPGQQLPPVHQQQQGVRAQLMRSPPQMSSPRYAMGLGQTVPSGSPDDMMPFTGDSFGNQMSQPQNPQQQQQMNPSDQLSSLVDNL